MNLRTPISSGHGKFFSAVVSNQGRISSMVLVFDLSSFGAKTTYVEKLAPARRGLAADRQLDASSTPDRKLTNAGKISLAGISAPKGFQPTKVTVESEDFFAKHPELKKRIRLCRYFLIMPSNIVVDERHTLATVLGEVIYRNHIVVMDVAYIKNFPLHRVRGKYLEFFLVDVLGT